MRHTQFKKLLCLLLIVVTAFTGIFITPTEASAKNDIYSTIEMKWDISKCTIYTGQEYRFSTGVSTRYYTSDKYKQDDYSKACEKIWADWTWTSSDNSIVTFISSRSYENGIVTPTLSDTLKGNGYPSLMGLKPGTAKITITSSILGTSLSCKVTVKDAELCCKDGVFYSNNEYAFQLKGNTTALRYTSSKPEVATVDETTGIVTALKKGKTTISCEAADGNTYKKTINIKKPGLSYSKITSYYFSGFREGAYSQFPIVAKGIDVKKWKSSNNKVVKVIQKANVGVLEIHGTGKCTVTCTDTSGKTYKCKVTIVGGKPWSGLNSGYRPTITEVKKHGYYNDINKVQDFGNVVFFVVDYGKEIDLKNGNKKMDVDTAEKKAKELLANRYPDKQIAYACSGDLLGFTSGKQYGRLWVGCYYVED